MWTVDRFKEFFSKVSPHLQPRAVIIWHGGEPMLLGPDFYRECYAYARSIHPGIQFSMQTNLLLYSSERWRDVFSDIMRGSISTSFDYEVKYRTLKGCANAYADRFQRKLDEVRTDGFMPLVIGTYDATSIKLIDRVYDENLMRGDAAVDLRFNYRYPAGRAREMGECISPEAYGEALIHLYDRWVTDAPYFLVMPLDAMLKRVLGMEFGRCPWTRHCGGRLMAVEPNGDVYNCGEYADMGSEYRFGNIFQHTMEEIVTSKPIRLIMRRSAIVPSECTDCRHFDECEGGCSRDSALFGNGVLGKFHYCVSWKMVFDCIKESVRTGEADRLIGRVRQQLAIAA